MKQLLAAILCSIVTIKTEARIARPNPYHIPVTVFSSGITESEFNESIDTVYKKYATYVSQKGATLVFNRLWDDGTVNSDTTESWGRWEINAYGGLARYPGMTKDGYTLVLCHELGHHLGGAPRFGRNTEWASCEGEADYWATRCMKEIGFSTGGIQNASLVVASVLASLGGEGAPQVSTPDPRVQRRTFEDHPEAQCRLDTYLQGLTCKSTGPMSKYNPRVNSCFSYPTAKTYSPGSRPRCWFAP